MSLEIQQMPAEKRYEYLLKQAVEKQQIWILTDDHGCVMLNTDEEDCVPVWPDESFAKDWATGEWQACSPHAVTLDVWLQRWTDGLAEDGVEVAVFPNPGEDGLIVSPDEFAYALEKQAG